MDKKIENHLTEVPETMLITLWAKAMETGRPDALLRDEKAVEILRQIDYDFTKFKNAKFSQAGCCVRANLIDKAAKTFINRTAGMSRRNALVRPRPTAGDRA